MNYFFALMICFAMTGLSANEENARWLLICDFNVALYLALAWFLGRRNKARGPADIADLQRRLEVTEVRRAAFEELLREVRHDPDLPEYIGAKIRQILLVPPRGQP